MPLTEQQRARRQLEGSLRRKFGHYVTHLSDDQLTGLEKVWGGVVSVLDLMLSYADARSREWEKHAASWSPPPGDGG